MNRKLIIMGVVISSLLVVCLASAGKKKKYTNKPTNYTVDQEVLREHQNKFNPNLIKEPEPAAITIPMPLPLVPPFPTYTPQPPRPLVTNETSSKKYYWGKPYHWGKVAPSFSELLKKETGYR